MTPKEFLAALEAQAPQESFTWPELVKLFPAVDYRALRAMLELLTDSGDLLPFGRPSARSWTLLTPARGEA